MAILLSDFVWEGVSGEMATVQGVRDGYIFKQLDTGESYIRRAGQWEFINLGLSYIKATKSGAVTTDANGSAAITFATLLADVDYTVALSCQDYGNQSAVAGFLNLTTTGFTVQTRYSRTGNVRPATPVSWLITRNYNT